MSQLNPNTLQKLAKEVIPLQNRDEALFCEITRIFSLKGEAPIVWKLIRTIGAHRVWFILEVMVREHSETLSVIEEKDLHKATGIFLQLCKEGKYLHPNEIRMVFPKMKWVVFPSGLPIVPA